jgi:hypothetical protein
VAENLDDIAERGTAEFYKEQVLRLVRLAGNAESAAARLELFDMATAFQKLAERSAATAVKVADPSAKKSA